MVENGPSIQVSYTFSKSLDDTSGINPNGNTTGAVTSTFPQNPFNTHAEKGPSAFDVANGFTASAAQDLQIEKAEFLQGVPRVVTAGWTLLSISTISSGAPFTIYSGIQQTGAGSNGVDRPNQIGIPQLSTARKVREDYFGKGVDNASFFSIPINLPGGTGPNQGYFGSLGRNTFRGPAFYDFDFSLIKDTPVGSRSGGSELFDVQFRAEFFNIFNIVNMGLPANTILGSGFGEISKTAGTSRQIQFSLKLRGSGAIGNRSLESTSRPPALKTAAGEEQFSGEPPGLIGGEQNRNRRNIGGLFHAAKGRVGDECIDQVGAHIVAGSFGRGKSRVHPVHANVDIPEPRDWLSAVPCPELRRRYDWVPVS